jgi:hypothetical protein
MIKRAREEALQQQKREQEELAMCTFKPQVIAPSSNQKMKQRPVSVKMQSMTQNQVKPSKRPRPVNDENARPALESTKNENLHEGPTSSEKPVRIVEKLSLSNFNSSSKIMSPES